MGAFGLVVFGNQQHLAGSAADADQDFTLNPQVMRVDLAIFDQSALVSLSPDGHYFSAPREFPAGVLSSLDIIVKVFRIRNKTAGVISRYDLVGYFDPITIMGRPYVRAL